MTDRPEQIDNRAWLAVLGGMADLRLREVSGEGVLGRAGLGERLPTGYESSAGSWLDRRTGRWSRRAQRDR